MPRWLVVGLGDPGRLHQGTRRSVGATAIDALADGAPFRQDGGCLVTEIPLGGSPVLLAKPLAYRDRSGEALAMLLERRRVDLEHAIVLLDDPGTKFGFVRVRTRAHANLHPGMRDIARAVSRPLPHIRIGTGAASPIASTGELLDWSEAERARLPWIFAGVKSVLELMVAGEAEKAMSLYNRRDVPVDQLVQSAAR